MDATNCSEGRATDRWFLFREETDFACDVPVAAFKTAAWILVIAQAILIIGLFIVFWFTRNKKAKLQLFFVWCHGVVGALFLLRSVTDGEQWNLGAAFDSRAKPDFFTFFAVWMCTLFWCSAFAAFSIIKLSLMSVPKMVTDGNGVEIRKTNPTDDIGVVSGACLVVLSALFFALSWGVGINVTEFKGKDWVKGRWSESDEFWWRLGCFFVAGCLVGLLIMAVRHINLLINYIEHSIKKTRELKGDGSSGENSSASLMSGVVRKLKVGKKVAYISGGVALLVWVAHAFFFPMFWWIALLHFANSMAFQSYELYVYRPQHLLSRMGIQSRFSDKKLGNAATSMVAVTSMEEP